MKVSINGEGRSFDSIHTVSELVDSLGMKSDRVAVELNREIVARDQWATTPLKEGDQLEIVHFVGGGSGDASEAKKPHPQLIKRRRVSAKLRTVQILSLVLLSVLSLFGLAAAQGPTKLHPGFNLFSKEQDMQLGKESAAEVRKQMVVIHDPFLTAYVNKIGQRLAATPEARDSGFPFTFEVIADPTINAFALPGGPMFINTGLLKAVDSEAQLAGVMGHEMSHVILRHGTNQASKANLIELPALLAGQMGGDSMLGQLAQAGIGLGAGGVLLHFSRGAESQADLMGSHLMAESGYNPLELAHFFEKLNSSQQPPEFLSDHPNPDHRERAIQAEAGRLPARDYTYQTGDFARMKQIVAQIHEPKPKPLQSQPEPQKQ